MVSIFWLYRGGCILLLTHSIQLPLLLPRRDVFDISRSARGILRDRGGYFFVRDRGGYFFVSTKKYPGGDIYTMCSMSMLKKNKIILFFLFVG